ncbi:DUF397 domain-containing protein [Streptomyces longwoodensis]|uniref:DUF397 domain-containing protein n=1 Tax=Streptomyces longwoodensis TaxID=68231 RepID=UPI00352C36E2
MEVATDAAAIHVRDSKTRRGPRLAFTGGAWAGFVAGLRAAGADPSRAAPASQGLPGGRPRLIAYQEVGRLLVWSFRSCTNVPHEPRAPRATPGHRPVPTPGLVLSLIPALSPSRPAVR